MKKILDYIKSRGKEASTWRGIILLATAAGVTLTEDQQAAIVALGMAVAGAVGVFFPDKAAK